jgi:hypothetical protein
VASKTAHSGGHGVGAAVAALLAVALAASGCASRTQHRADGGTVGSVLSCLRASGADAVDASAHRDLQVSAGEVAVSFSTFDAYVGIAQGAHEAAGAAAALDAQLAVLQQAGHATIHRAAIYYFDAPIVPRSAGRLLAACLDGTRDASTEMAALAADLPAIALPRPLETRFLARCAGLGTAGACACAYRRASRLLRFAQVDGVGRTWPERRASALVAGLLRTCAPPA